MKRSRRIISSLLVLAMVLSLMPTTIWADEVGDQATGTNAADDLGEDTQEPTSSQDYDATETVALTASYDGESNLSDVYATDTSP